MILTDKVALTYYPAGFCQNGKMMKSCTFSEFLVRDIRGAWIPIAISRDRDKS